MIDQNVTWTKTIQKFVIFKVMIQLKTKEWYKCALSILYLWAHFSIGPCTANFSINTQSNILPTELSCPNTTLGWHSPWFKLYYLSFFEGHFFNIKSARRINCESRAWWISNLITRHLEQAQNLIIPKSNHDLTNCISNWK